MYINNPKTPPEHVFPNQAQYVVYAPNDIRPANPQCHPPIKSIMPKPIKCLKLLKDLINIFKHKVQSKQMNITGKTGTSKTASRGTDN